MELICGDPHECYVTLACVKDPHLTVDHVADRSDANLGSPLGARDHTMELGAIFDVAADEQSTPALPHR